MAEPLAGTDRLIEVTLDDSALPPASPEAEQDRRVALYELTQENVFGLPGREGRPAPAGPYRLALDIRDRLMVFDIRTEAGEPSGAFHMSLTPFRQIIKDYFQICEAYFDAVRRLPPAQIEAIDMGRRGLHDEGSRIMLERLAGKVDTDMATARRLFTLLCALQPKG